MAGFFFVETYYGETAFEKYKEAAKIYSITDVKIVYDHEYGYE